MITNRTLTFETKCYERDWRYLIRKGRMKQMIENCSYPFESRRLFINNVKDPAKVMREADKLVSAGIIDSWFLVEEHAGRALEFYGIDKESFSAGYYYSIAELVSIYLCETGFLLHFSSDSIMEPSDGSWISGAMKAMDENHNILVANPTWDFKPHEVEAESHNQDTDWWYSYGFSDQCYLIRTEDFRKDIYKEHHKIAERYPTYGGELFEKRVFSYMMNHKLERITNKRVSYIHKNIPKHLLKRIIKINRK